MVIAPLAAPGDTWGISGPDFLKIYGVAAAVLIIGTLLHRAVTGRGDAGANRQPTGVEIAYLRGGAALAVTASIAGLRAAGAVDSPERGVLAASGPYPAGATRLDWAVYDAAQRQVRQRDLLTDTAVASAVVELRESLVQAGWLRTPSDRARLRMGGWLTLLVAAFGVARIVAGVNNGRPVTYLVVLTIAVVLIGLVLLTTVGERSPYGNRVVRAAVSSSRHLSPDQGPSWATYGLTGAAMGVAVFGATALWAADPGFAEQAEIQRQLGSASGSSGYTGGDAGGGSSCSGGSSCGGGGGCGGGGCGG